MGNTTPEGGEGTLSYAASATGRGPWVLGRDARTIPLEPTARFADLVAGRGDTRTMRFYLVLEDMRVRNPPDVGYNVFLDLPRGAEPRPDSPYYVGTFTFFTAGSYGGADAKGQGEPRSSVLQLGDALERLRPGGQLADGLTVTIVPALPPAEDAAPEIGRIQLLGKTAG